MKFFWCNSYVYLVNAVIQVSPTRPRFRCNTVGTFDQIELRKVQWNFRVLIQCHVTSLVHAEVRINLIALTYL